MLSGLTAAGTQAFQLLLADKATETIYTCTGLCSTAVCKFALTRSSPEQHCRAGSGCGPLHSPISLLHQCLHDSQFHPHFYSASLHLISSQSVALRLAVAQLALHTGCCQPTSPHTQPVPASSWHPSLCTGLVPPGTTSQPVALRRSIDPPGPRSLESRMLR